MLQDYKDIKKRIKEEPLWYDENGTPRYDDFHPTLSPNIYAYEVILMRIACQYCGKEFLVELNWHPWGYLCNPRRHRESFSNLLEMWNKGGRVTFCPVHYGDPPPHDCVGDTMNCIDLGIVQFWRWKLEEGWYREKKLEVKLEDKTNEEL